MRMPRVINKTNLKEIYSIPASTMQLTLNLETAHTATIQMPITGQQVPAVGDWVSIQTPQGEDMVMRVRTVNMAYDTDAAQLQLEHIINSLKDEIMFGKTTPGDLGGSGGKVAPATAIRKILTKQSIWQLGTCDYTEQQPYEFSSVSLYNAIDTVCSAMLDYYWTYDTSSLPFTLNVKHRPTTRSCEMRQTRNLSTMRIQTDRSKMYTRFYPTGNKNLTISDINDGKPYVEKNTEIYGVISKTETDNTVRSKEMLKARALAKLERHAEPEVVVTISGLELSQVTGEPFDRLTIGAKCGVPLHEYNTVIDDTIMTVAWADCVANPEAVTVTLANRKEDVAQIIAQLAKSGGGGAKATAEDNETDYAELIDTKNQAGAIARAVIGTDPETGEPNWSRVAQLLAEGNSMDAKVNLVVKDVDGANNTIDAASIVLGINNQSGSYVRIAARNINLDGYVTATQLNAVSAMIDNLTSGSATALDIRAVSLSAANLRGSLLYVGGNLYGPKPVYDINGNIIYVLAR